MPWSCSTSRRSAGLAFLKQPAANQSMPLRTTHGPTPGESGSDSSGAHSSAHRVVTHASQAILAHCATLPPRTLRAPQPPTSPVPRRRPPFEERQPRGHRRATLYGTFMTPLEATKTQASRTAHTSVGVHRPDGANHSNCRTSVKRCGRHSVMAVTSAHPGWKCPVVIHAGISSPTPRESGLDSPKGWSCGQLPTR